MACTAYGRAGYKYIGRAGAVPAGVARLKVDRGKDRFIKCDWINHKKGYSVGSYSAEKPIDMAAEPARVEATRPEPNASVPDERERLIESISQLISAGR